MVYNTTQWLVVIRIMADNYFIIAKKCEFPKDNALNFYGHTEMLGGVTKANCL